MLPIQPRPALTLEMGPESRDIRNRKTRTHLRVVEMWGWEPVLISLKKEGWMSWSREGVRIRSMTHHSASA